MTAKDISIQAWDNNAAFWNTHMADGSAFQTKIVEPATFQLLNPLAGETILDLACGNGVLARKLAALGCRVTAVDSSQEMLKCAQDYPAIGHIDYLHGDLLQENILADLEPHSFDRAVCNMAFMDIPCINSIFKLTARLLKPRGCFVISQTHPCFEKGVGPLFFEIGEENGVVQQKCGVKVMRYLTPHAFSSRALPDMPDLHMFFHRPLSDIFKAAFDAGFVLDGFEEPSFKDVAAVEHKGWHQITDIPVIAVFRFQQRG